MGGWVGETRTYRSSTCSRSFSPYLVVGSSEKVSMREAMLHLLARYLYGEVDGWLSDRVYHIF